MKLVDFKAKCILIYNCIKEMVQAGEIDQETGRALFVEVIGKMVAKEWLE